MLVTIVLHGKLKTFSPNSLRINAETAQQVVSFLLRTFKGIRQMLKRGWYRFSLTDDGKSRLLSEDSRFDVSLPDGVDTIHLVPVEGVYGRKFIGIIAGVLLIAAGIALTFMTGGIGTLTGAQLASIGVGLIIGGATTLLGGIVALFTPIPKIGDLQQGDNTADRQSTLFTGATNRLGKGVGVPVTYGRFYCGSNVISQSITTEEVL
jgi:predicted phage tail protein